MIEKFSAENYGPLKKVELALTPLHALIGPNDSGKSTILRGIQEVVDAATRGMLRNRFGGRSHRLRVFLEQSLVYEDVPPHSRGTWKGSVQEFSRGALLSNIVHGLPQEVVASSQWLTGARLVRFEADRMRASGQLLTKGNQLRFVDERGSGLPSIYDFLRDHASDGYEEIRAQFCKLFPSVRTLRLEAVDAGTKALSVVLLDGTEVSADKMSEGMLYFLGYAALKHLEGASVLLVEEPETGLHPLRIAEVMRILRAISESGTQVILATHSPLVINELKPDEVTVVTRDNEHGTKVKPIKDTPRFDERKELYSLGELWLSYANGLDESPLLNGTPRKGALGT